MPPEPRRVLVVDDEPDLVEIVQQSLADEGFEALRAFDGPSAVETFLRDGADLIILDLNLPGFPGTEVLRRIRAVRDVPIIMLTSRADEVERVVGLESGADDYVGKPFSARELVARVKAVLRRGTRRRAERPGVLRIGDLTIDPRSHDVRVGETAVSLTPTQYKLLEMLAQHVGETLTRDQLIGRISENGDVYDRTLDRHIANLRARIEPNPASPRYIRTVFGIGYKIVPTRG